MFYKNGAHFNAEYNLHERIGKFVVSLKRHTQNDK